MKNKTYPLERSFLYRLRNKSKLAEKLNLPKNFFRRSVEVRYSVYDIIQGGKSRTISDPCKRLKNIQRRLLKFLQRIDTPEWLISGKKGKSYIANAEFHRGNQYVLTADICQFYNNCKEIFVIRMFKRMFEMDHDVAKALANLVCLDGHLPTGSPTSQVIAYWTYSDIFYNINQIAFENHCLFSLYVDDMAFSSKSPIGKNVLYLINKELGKVGLCLKSHKTKSYSQDECKFITGTVIDSSNNLKVPNKRRLSIINTFEEYIATEGADREKYKNSVIGKINSARQIEKDVFPNLYRELNRKNIT